MQFKFFTITSILEPGYLKLNIYCYRCYCSKCSPIAIGEGRSLFSNYRLAISRVPGRKKRVPGRKNRSDPFLFQLPKQHPEVLAQSTAESDRINQSNTLKRGSEFSLFAVTPLQVLANQK